MMINLIVPLASSGERLDKFLQKTYPTFSRSQIQKTIKDGLITVNEQPVAVHRFLKTGDRVQGALTIVAPLVCTPNAMLTVPVIAETKEYIVIDKPSGMIAHQADGHREPDSVANWSVAHDPKIATVGDDPLRPGIVHRLDQDVSGCMVIAKTQSMFDHLKRAFQGGHVQKIYTALIYGALPNRGGTIDFDIARSATKEGRMAARPRLRQGSGGQAIDDGKEAATEYTVLNQYQDYALVEARPRTGRTHQIRVHFHALGHPIVGDPLYQPKDKRKQIIDRIFLHATTLSFTDLFKQQQAYTSSLPKELQQVIEKLGNWETGKIVS